MNIFIAKRRVLTKFLIGFSLLSLISCQNEFLEMKPDKALLIPKTLTDLQSLLDNTNIMNQGTYFGLLSADEIYIPDNVLQSNATVRNIYTWADEVYEQSFLAPDWVRPYQQVFYTNIVLEALDNFENEHGIDSESSALRGSALFYRAFAFYGLSQVFAAPFVDGSADTELGVPILLKSDVNQKYNRGTLRETYHQVINDLMVAETLLPTEAFYRSRPSKIAVYALLARVFLSMEDYSKANEYAKKSLLINDALIDYNTLDSTAGNPFPITLPTGNNEVIFFSYVSTGLSSVSLIIDSTLYKAYHYNDLRKANYFLDRGNGVINYKGNYTGNSFLFNGLATDELYLIAAECEAREGDVALSLDYLNKLIKRRWRNGSFKAYNTMNRDDVLMLILEERKKELLLRNTRWTDLRRLNNDERYETTLQRVVAGVALSLPPRDRKYVLPIPNQEISISGLPQNPR